MIFSPVNYIGKKHSGIRYEKGICIVACDANDVADVHKRVPALLDVCFHVKNEKIDEDKKI